MDIATPNYSALLARISLGGELHMGPWATALALAATLYLLLVAYLTMRWIVHSKPARPAFPGPATIIICAHNEAENLRKNLPYILGQQYPDFEVVVVNDRSTDLTGKVLEVFQRKHDNLWVVNITTETGSKKLALDAGVKAARHKVLALTDADCRPATPFWLATLLGHMDDETDIVLGFSPYEKQPGLLNKVIRYETLYTAYLYGGLAMGGLPYMGVGRNMAYRKSVYQASTAHQKFADTLSGDDDLLINEMADASNTAVCADSNAITWSTPKATWAEWWHQKRRHSQAGNHYKPTTKALLSFIYVPQLLFYFGVIALFVSALFLGINYLWLGLGLLAVRWLMLVILLPAPMNVLEQASLLPFVLICDFILSVILFSLGCVSAIKVRTWTNNYLPHNAHKKT